MIRHCPKGHPLTPENVVYLKKGLNKPKRRRCRICVNERRRRYRERVGDTIRPKQNKYAKKHYDKHSEQVKMNVKQHRKTLKNIILDHYGAKCNCCGETIREFLCVDHINGGGNKHRKELKTGCGVTFYRWLIKNNFPDGFQILCFNCNSAKHICGACPHKIT